MTISAETAVAGPYNGDGSTTAFVFAFKCFSTAEIVVYVESSAGVQSLQVLTTNYSVALNSDQDTSPGGTVTMVTAPASGETLHIASNTPYNRTDSFSNASGFYPNVLNDARDKTTLQIQQLRDMLDRVPMAPVGDGIGAIPSVASRSSKYFGFDSDGNPVALDLVNVGETITLGDGWSTALGNPLADEDLVVVVKTIAELQTLTGDDTDDVVICVGRSTPGDWGQPRLARWATGDQSAAVTADEMTASQGDGGMVVAPASDRSGASGAWVFEDDEIMPDFYGAGTGDQTGAIDTAAINKMFSANTNHNVYKFRPQVIYYVTNCTVDRSNIYIDATGSRIFGVSDGTADVEDAGSNNLVTTDNTSYIFNFNSEASSSNPESTSKSYIFWTGGNISSTLTNPTNLCAFKVNAIRQFDCRKVVFGDSASVTLTKHVWIGGLGAHKFDKNRHLLPGTSAYYCPYWSSTSDAGVPITTSTFEDNEFILNDDQKAFYVNGGWNRWRIKGGFMNAAENVAVIHFTNNSPNTFCHGLEILDIGFEQAKQNGKFVHLEDVGGTSASAILIRAVFNGDPAGGGHSHVDIEDCNDVTIGAGTRLEATIANSNDALNIDANCTNVVIDRGVDFGAGAQVTYACPRNQITHEGFVRIFNALVTGYNSQTLSNSLTSQAMDMSAIAGSGNYPVQMPPLAWVLHVSIQDSGSSSGTAYCEIATSSSLAAQQRHRVECSGLANDTFASQTIVVPADANGDLWFRGQGTGASTGEVYVSLVGYYS